jgi:hypothetical protein
LTACGAPEALAQFATGTNTRLVNVIEISDHEDPVDLTVIFNCSMRFITNLPASEGKEVRIQLAPLPDCGLSPGAGARNAADLGGGNILAAASRVPGARADHPHAHFQAERALRGRAGHGSRGLRLRLIDRTRGRGKIVVGQPAEAVSNFAINLDSQPALHARGHPARARAPEGAGFVSEAMVEGRSGTGCGSVRSSAVPRRTGS